MFTIIQSAMLSIMQTLHLPCFQVFAVITQIAVKLLTACCLDIGLDCVRYFKIGHNFSNAFVKQITEQLIYI